MTRHRGFTLVELMVVVSILTIVVVLAAPGMRSFVIGQRVKGLAFDLTADLLFARSEALKRNVSVSITPAADGWYAGWTVDAAGTTLMSRESSRDVITFDSAPSTITFANNGRVSSSAERLSITVRSTEASGQDRCVELDPSGRARVNRGACS